METPLQNYVEQQIFTIRGIQVMLDSDLADLYKTETKYINRAVKRNPDRFPYHFVFQLTEQEWNYLRCQIGTSKSKGGRRNLPFAFSEHGVAMLSTVLKTETSISVSIQIIKAFVNMRRFFIENASIFQRIDRLELKQLQSDEKIDQIFKALDTKTLSTDKGIFFNGQIFDAYVFVSEIIKKAKHHIILIDNYI
ncbi:MAG TPA: ORF6N domain-containing protein, partial [Bacteroidales bacterium]|nr:ORF6N domain-containing protein [Bacteroidales bacterium]